MSHDDFKFEPVRGLPENLPDGEHVIWQGGPDWVALARHVFHIRFIAAYFAVILAWRTTAGLYDGVPVADLLASTLWPLGLAALLLAIVLFIAWGYGLTTVHTITNRRIVIRSGVAFQITFNLPFKVVRGAGLRVHRDGTGDIPLELDGSAHIAYLHIWPNARPWHFTNVQPMLRNIREPEAVAELLAAGLMAANGTTRAAVHKESKRTAQLYGPDREVERMPGPIIEAAE